MKPAATSRRSAPASASANVSPERRVVSIALILSLALVACRMLMTETLRSPQDPLGGGGPAPVAPGPATGILLDLGFCIPAIILLGRRAFDDRFRLTFCWSFIPMGLLALLAALSPLWAADKFAAVVSGMHLCCALVFVWSTAQLVRSWVGLRLIAGICVGLLVILATVGYHFRVVEFSQLQKQWAINKDTILKSHGWQPGSYQAMLFEGRVLKGMPMGYNTSPNTYAALLVLLGIVSAGVVLQQLSDLDLPRRLFVSLVRRLRGDDETPVIPSTVDPIPQVPLALTWLIIPALAVVALPLLIKWTACRAAYATPVIAACILFAAWLLRRPLARYSGLAYFLSIGSLGALTAFIVRHGMRYQSLWHDSLTFRWHYWVGSYRVLTDGFAHFPRQFMQFFFGVGWENFGAFYLGHRLPIAAEEIHDPHNFIVRVFVELGMIGGVLLLGWMLRLWWELTRPRMPGEPIGAGAVSADSEGSLDYHPRRPLDAAPLAYGTAKSIGIIAGIAIIAIAINIPLAIDFGSRPGDEDAQAYSMLELFVRLFFLVALFAGLWSAALRLISVPVAKGAEETKSIELDARPSPWILWAILAALGTFLIHNLIEFSLFEPGPLFLFALLTGGALGIRSQSRNGATESPAPVAPDRHEAKTSAESIATRPTPRAGRSASARAVAPLIALGLACVAWLGAAIFIATPIAVAENLAHQSDADAMAATEHPSNELISRAAGSMNDAAAHVPWNADYAYRAARLGFMDGEVQRDPAHIKKLLDAACAADPSAVMPLHARADYEFNTLADPEAGRRDYERVLALDPNNVRMRLEYARQLAKFAGRNPKFAAAAQFEYVRAEDMNNQLNPDEIKRLTPAELEKIHQEVRNLDAKKVPPAGARTF